MNEMKLWNIEEGIARLLEMRENAEEAGQLPEEIALIDEAIKQYFSSEVKKVDGTAVAVTIFKNSVAEIDWEIQRLQCRRKIMTNRIERIKANALAAMQAHGVTKLETALHCLRVQANGGVEPLELSKGIPPYLCSFTISVDFKTYVKLKDFVEQAWALQGVYFQPEPGEKREEALGLGGAVLALLEGAHRQPDHEAIRAALKERVPCPLCVLLPRYGIEPDDDCVRCEGRGTVPAEIPGARLLPRGVHLRIS